jgi:hypothetical protein
MKSNRRRFDHNPGAVHRERPRNHDGTFRRADSSSQDTRRNIVAHWVEEEVAWRRRFLDGSFAKIAALVVEAAHRRILPRAPLPAGIKFPDNYTLSGRGALKAFARYRARAKPNWANRKKADSNLGYKTATRKSPNQPLGLVRLQFRPRLPFSKRGAAGDLDLGIVDLGDLDLKGLETLEELLSLFRSIEVEPSRTKTTLQADLFYRADPKFEEIRRYLTPREQERIAGIWERGRQRALKNSQKHDGRKSEAESPNQGSEAPAKAETSVSNEPPARSEGISYVDTSRAAGSHADGKTPKSARRSTQGKKADRETLPVEERRLRDKIIAHFSANPQQSYWLADLVRVLKVEPASLRSVLNDVKKEGIVEEYHPGLWRFKKS